MKKADDESNLKASIRSADPNSAKKITDILYQLVDDGKIKSFRVKKVSKGKNSIDLNPFVPLLEHIDIESLYENAKNNELFTLGSGLIGLGIAKKNTIHC